LFYVARSLGGVLTYGQRDGTANMTDAQSS